MPRKKAEIQSEKSSVATGAIMDTKGNVVPEKKPAATPAPVEPPSPPLPTISEEDLKPVAPPPEEPKKGKKTDKTVTAAPAKVRKTRVNPGDFTFVVFEGNKKIPVFVSTEDELKALIAQKPGVRLTFFKVLKPKVEVSISF